MIDERKNVQTTPPAPTAGAVGPCPTLIQISRTPRQWKFTQHHRTTRRPLLHLFLLYYTVDGQWSAWSNWSDCSKSCENGTRSRARRCNFSATAPHGKPCVGNEKEAEPCNTDLCPSEFFIIANRDIQPTLVISKSKGPSKTLRDIRTSTYQICSIEEKAIRTTKFHK